VLLVLFLLLLLLLLLLGAALDTFGLRLCGRLTSPVVNLPLGPRLCLFVLAG
jgi:hypothetical protein